VGANGVTSPPEALPTYSRSFEGWPFSLANLLAGVVAGGLVSYGLRGVWVSEWTFTFGGAADQGGATGFPSFPTTSTSDVGPWNDGRIAAASRPGAVATWKKAAGMRSTLSGGYLYWIDDPAVGKFSYRVNGGSWVAAPITPSGSHKLKRFWISGNISTLDVRNATAAAAPVGCSLVGFEPWIAPKGTPNGLIVHNIAKGGQRSSDFVYTSSGDPLAFFDSCIDDTGQVLCNADLIGIMFTNDVNVSSTDYTTTTANFNAIIDRVRAYADGFLMAYVEQGETRLDGTQGTAATQAALRNAHKAVAANRGLAFLSLYDAFADEGVTGFAQAVAAGLMADRSHEAQALHDSIAARLLAMLTT